MDNLNYRYYANTNQLRYITDSVQPNDYAGGSDHRIIDIDGQADSNYVYDPIGNLIADNAEKITSIKWNVYGKIQEITRTATATVPTTNIKYTYDASGNRISQVVTSDGTKKYTWYVRDAQGNILSTYTAAGDASNLADLKLYQEENFLYGSSRLGLQTIKEEVTNGPDNNPISYEDRTLLYERGRKQYELTNHLGNVLATISDKKFGVSSAGSSLINYYEPDIVTAQDYYPFGMMSRVALPNSDVPYRFGFNGKLNDNDVKGGFGLQQDYGMRIYDPRVGRFLSVDPLTKDYAELTPYQFASNRPIDGIDLDGEEWKPLTDYFADKAKANGYPRLSGFIRSLGAGDVQTQTQDAIKSVAKGKIAEVAVQVYGYTSFGMFDNTVKLAKKAVIDRDPEAQGEALGLLAQGVFGEVVAARRPAAPRVYEEPVTAVNNQATAANNGVPSQATTPNAVQEIAPIIEEPVVQSSSSIGAEQLTTFKLKMQNAFKGIDKTHLDAAIGDMAGNPIVKYGKVWDHLSDITNHLKNLNGRIRELNKMINNDVFSGSALEEAKELRSSLQKTYDSYSGALQRAANKYNKDINVKKQ